MKKQEMMQLEKQTSAGGGSVSLGLKNKRDLKQAQRKEAATTKILRSSSMIVPSPASSQQTVNSNKPALSKRTSRIMKNSTKITEADKPKTQFSSGGLGLLGKQKEGA